MATSTRTIADIVLPRPHARTTGLLRDALLVIGGVAFVALTSQVSIPLQPVPITLQTLAVLLVGAAYGWQRGAVTLLAYYLAGAAGLPLFANHNFGIATAVGPTGGYQVGFIFAAALVGYLAEQGWDRTPWLMALAMVLGNLVIYAFGVLWLAYYLHLPITLAIKFGLSPFLLGDAIKLGIAVILLPVAHLALSRLGAGK